MTSPMSDSCSTSDHTTSPAICAHIIWSGSNSSHHKGHVILRVNFIFSGNLLLSVNDRFSIIYFHAFFCCIYFFMKLYYRIGWRLGHNTDILEQTNKSNCRRTGLVKHSLYCIGPRLHRTNKGDDDEGRWDGPERCHLATHASWPTGRLPTWIIRISAAQEGAVVQRRSGSDGP